MAVTQVGTPSTVVQAAGSNTGTVTGAWSGTQPRTADDYLVACVTAYGTTASATIAESSGTWTQLEDLTASSVCQSSMWGKFAEGGDAAPTFTATEAGTAASARMTCYLIELTGADFNSTTPATGSMTGTSGSPFVTTTGETVPTTGGYAITCYNMVSATGTFSGFTPGTSWTNVSTTASTSTVDHAFVDVYAGPPSGSTLAESVTHTTTTTFECGVIVVFQALQVPVQPLINIADPLDTTSENAVWNAASNTNSVVFTTSGVQSTTSTSAALYSSFNSLATYNMTGGSITEKLVNAGNQALVSWEIIVAEMVDPSAGNLVGFYLNQNLLSAIYRVAGTNTFSTSVAYSPAQHVYFKITESGGVTTWATSANGRTWVPFFSIADPISMTSLFVAPLDAGTYNVETTSTTVTLSSINIVPGNSYGCGPVIKHLPSRRAIVG
jgi:hypothetical protein